MSDKSKHTMYMPSEAQFQTRLRQRRQRGQFGKYYYYFSMSFAIIMLVILFATIINRAFGSVAVVFEVQPEDIAEQYGMAIEEMDADQLARLIEAEAGGGLRRLIRDQLSRVEPSQFTQTPLEEMLRGSTVPDGFADQAINDVGEEGWVAIATANFSEEALYGYVIEQVIGREIVAAWTLAEAIFQFEPSAGLLASLDDVDARIEEQQTIVNEASQDDDNYNELVVRLRQLESEHRAIVGQAVSLDHQTNHPDAELVRYHAWLNEDFITSPMAAQATNAGIRGAALGTIYLMSIVIFFALPVGVGTAIYLEEYTSDSWLKRIIQLNVRNLAGVPSIIYGLLGLAIFVIALSRITSGQLFGSGSDSGRTILSAGLTLALLILPIIIISSQEALRAVPSSLREASYGLGATHWQTIWRTVLPAALPGILTGTILAVSRAIGETAPLVVIGASSFLVVDPSGPFSQFAAVPLLIYQWSQQPQAQLFREVAAAAIIILLVLMLTLNAVAIILRNRFSVRY